MPDWSYHPFFKPLLFRLGPERARRLTFGALDLQSRFALGRAVFRLMSPPPPPPEAAVEAFGLRFPSPVGLGAGLNPEMAALDFLQDHFGFGWLELGPAAAEAEPGGPGTGTLRLEEARSLVLSGRMAAPSAAEAAARAAGVARRIPWGFALRGADLAAAATALVGAADFFTLPWEALSRPEEVRDLAALGKPLLLRIPAGPDGPALGAAVDAAAALGIRGGILGTGEPTGLRPEGEVEGPFLRGWTLGALAALGPERLARFPMIAAGGAESPAEARELLAAGARLVQVRSGFVFAGPGLPVRIVRELLAPGAALPAPAAPAEPSGAHRLGSLMVAFTGWVLVASGLFALVLAATVKLLPPDVRYLGMSMRELCDRNACRIVHFMAHDRVSFGGSIISVGLIYHWLAARPLREGRAWAWWALLLSGVFGFASFLTYLGYGYLDPWHGLATLALLPFYLAGMALTWKGLRGPRGIATLLEPGAPGWAWSPARRGQMGVGFAAFGMVAGGLTIMAVGMTRVFVPTDLAYMGATREQLQALNPRLIPLIAHDRSGFGGGLFSGGLAIAAALWCGARPGEPGLWWAMLLSGLVGFGCAIGVHPIVGYTSFVHLLPAYLGFGAFLLGMALLRRPLAGPAAAAFADL